jgi:hypothetical protein
MRSVGGDWEALVPPDTATLDRPTGTNRWLVPVVDLDGERLIWKDATVPSRYARPSAGLLERFIGLGDAPSGAIRDYARRWGVLRICDHGLPATHNPQPVPVKTGPITWCRPVGWRQGIPWDPLEAWRRYARQMRALLNIGARVHESQPGRLADWEVLYPRSQELPGRPWWGRQVAADRAGVAYQLKEWLRMGQVELEPAWDEPHHLSLRIGVAGLFGALVVQLALAIAKTDGLALCSACGMTYLPGRRPNPKRRRYCSRCRARGAPQRDAAADYRRRVTGSEPGA